MKRREFLELAAAAPLLRGRQERAATGKVPYVDFLKESAVSKEVIDRWLRGPSWARFDPEIGYVLWNYLPLDGMDGSATISTIQANGARHKTDPGESPGICPRERQETAGLPLRSVSRYG